MVIDHFRIRVHGQTRETAIKISYDAACAVANAAVGFEKTGRLGRVDIRLQVPSQVQSDGMGERIGKSIMDVTQ